MEQHYGRDSQITLDGVTKTVREWAAGSKVKIGTVLTRLNRGWPQRKAIMDGLVRQEFANTVLEIDGVRRTMKQWAKRSGQTVRSLYTRLQRGIPFKQAVCARPHQTNQPLDPDRVAKIMGRPTAQGLDPARINEIVGQVKPVPADQNPSYIVTLAKGTDPSRLSDLKYVLNVESYDEQTRIMKEQDYCELQGLVGKFDELVRKTAVMGHP